MRSTTVKTRDDVENKAARALEAARAFLARSPAGHGKNSTPRERETGEKTNGWRMKESAADETSSTTTAVTTTTTGGTAERTRDGVVDGVPEARDESPSTRTRTETNLVEAFEEADDARTRAAPATPASPALELSSSEDEGADDARGASNSDEGAMRETRDADAGVVAALRADVARLHEALESERWMRESYEARVLEAEKIAEEAKAKTIETALDPVNQLTAEQVSALRAEIEQVEYLKRLLARAEQMRNAARQETKTARDKHEKDLRIIREEVTTMESEMENLRRRVKVDKAKFEAMERATVEAADEFALLFSRQENTRRLLAGAIFVIIALATRIVMNGQGWTLPNMYMY